MKNYRPLLGFVLIFLAISTLRGSCSLTVSLSPKHIVLETVGNNSAIITATLPGWAFRHSGDDIIFWHFQPNPQGSIELDILEDRGSVQKVRVTSKYPGTATLTAVTRKGKTDTATIVSKLPSPKSISLSESFIRLDESGKFSSREIIATVAPDEAGNKNIDWGIESASSPNCIQVIQSGTSIATIQAKTVGRAVVRAVTEDGGIIAKLEVIVEPVYNIDNHMILTPNFDYSGTGASFPFSITDSQQKKIKNRFAIGKTEVTYELWRRVYAWAVSADRGTKAYSFQNQGKKGGLRDWQKNLVENLSGDEAQPVVMVSWRDAVVWANALTEWKNDRDGTSYKIVYKESNGEPLRDSRDSHCGTFITSPPSAPCDDVVQDTSADGFRLPTSVEWEFSARLREDLTNTVPFQNLTTLDATPKKYSFTKGNSASGAITFYNNNSNANGEPAKSANNAVAIYNWFWNGSTWLQIGTNGTLNVGTKTKNGISAFDMSGNVSEWCFNTIGTRKVVRGGSWIDNASFLQIGNEHSLEANITGYGVGFRVARSH